MTVWVSIFLVSVMFWTVLILYIAHIDKKMKLLRELIEKLELEHDEDSKKI